MKWGDEWYDDPVPDPFGNPKFLEECIRLDQTPEGKIKLERMLAQIQVERREYLRRHPEIVDKIRQRIMERNL